MSIAAGLSAVAALFVAPSAHAGRIEGFQSRPSTTADAACVSPYWTGVSNTCTRTIYVQAAATLPAGTYSANAAVYGNASTKFNAWGVNSSLDTIWTTGEGSHTTDYYGNNIWATFTGLTYSAYVPSAGALLFQVKLAPGQIVGNYTY